jgi:hypothetical protein
LEFVALRNELNFRKAKLNTWLSLGYVGPVRAPTVHLRKQALPDARARASLGVMPWHSSSLQQQPCERD